MGIFHKATLKEILEIRNRITLDSGIPILEMKGFKKSPFSTSGFGKDEHGYTYNLCRLTGESNLENIEIQILRNDDWIKVFLNIFKLQPNVLSIENLNGLDGLQYKLSPNNVSEMRLRSDDIIGSPIFKLGYLYGHKLSSHYTNLGLSRGVNKLTINIANDLGNIEKSVQRWHELHQPLTTSWTGQEILR